MQALSHQDLSSLFGADGQLLGDEYLLHAEVVLTTNESHWIKHFAKSKKVLLGHSIFMRDTIPSPAALNCQYFNHFDYYFCPSMYYMNWTINSLFDGVIFLGKNMLDTGFSGKKTLIPGGYVKASRGGACSSKSNSALMNRNIKRILYVPSVYSPEHSGHSFHTHGIDIISSIAENCHSASITCRPHPTDRQRLHTLKVIDAFFGNPRIDIDLSLTPNPVLYFEPDILVTDMSGFAFKYALETSIRPIFFIQKEEADNHPRFMAIAERVGRVAFTTQELVSIVSMQLKSPDLLDPTEREYLSKTFYRQFNNIGTVIKDLIAIYHGNPLEHWTSLTLY